MNIMVVSHTYIAPVNREKWRVFAREHKDITLTVVFPHLWRGQLLSHEALTEETTVRCRFVPLHAHGVGNEVRYWYAPVALWRLLRTSKPDLVYVEQGDAALSYAQVIATSWLAGLRPWFFFFTWINWVPHHSRLYKLAWTWVERFNRFCSHGAVVGNPTAGALLRYKGFYKPARVIPQLGVDVHSFTPAKSLPRKTSIIGFFGRLVPEKGVEQLLDVFIELSSEFTTWNLRFVGKGPLSGLLQKRVAAHGLENRVEIIDSVPHEAMPGLMQKIDILTLPSVDTPAWKEQFGHVLIEAMACRVPVVASDAGDIASVVQDAGVVYKQGDVTALREALRMLMGDKEVRRDFAMRGYKRVHQHYSHEQIAQALHTFWQETCQRG